MLARLIAFPQKTSANGGSSPHKLADILSLLNRVSAVADDAALLRATALEQVFEEVCTFTGWPIGHLYAQDGDDSPQYISDKVWRLDPELDPTAIAEFMKLSEDTVFERGKGLIGIIAETREARAVPPPVARAPSLPASPAPSASAVSAFVVFPCGAVSLPLSSVALPVFCGVGRLLSPSRQAAHRPQDVLAKERRGRQRDGAVAATALEDRGGAQYHLQDLLGQGGEGWRRERRGHACRGRLRTLFLFGCTRLSEDDERSRRAQVELERRARQLLLHS